jgi:hypothetical protein
MMVDSFLLLMVVWTRQLLLVIHARIKGDWVILGVFLIVLLMAWRVCSTVVVVLAIVVFRVIMTSLLA